MSTLSIATSPPRASKNHRRMTVNERVDHILHDALQAEDEPRTVSADARNEACVRRSRQLANLYTSSMEDKFVRSRIPSDMAPSGFISSPKSVPKNAHLGRRKVTDVPPILLSTPADAGDRFTKQQRAASTAKPAKCYATCMLEHLQHQQEDERRKTEHSQFPQPTFAPPKPWYNGYSSSHKVPASTVDANVRRYGAYGTIKMIASDLVSGTAPRFELHASQSLDAIAYKDSADPWSPLLHGSPTLWPEDANYATGSKLQANKMLRCPSPEYRFVNHVVGAMGPAPNDRHFVRMQHVHSQDARVLEAALDQEKDRRRQEIAYNKDKLAHWKAQLQFEPLASKMDHAFVKVHATRAKELTILRNPEYCANATYSDHVAKLRRERFTLRWHNLAVLLDVMKKTPCRRPVLQDIDKLFALSYELSLKNLHHLELNRQQFWELLAKEYPLVDATHVNRVFSSYDCTMEDRLDMRLFLATVRAMRVQQGTPIELLTMALHDFDLTKRQVVAKAEHFVAVLSMCSGSDEEEHALRGHALNEWHHIVQGFETEKETRRQRRLRGLDPLDEDSAMGVCEELYKEREQLTTEDETQSEVESLLFLARDDEPHAVPIKYVRKALCLEKQLLQDFTDALLKRREECNAIAAPVNKPLRMTTAMAMAAGNHQATL